MTTPDTRTARLNALRAARDYVAGLDRMSPAGRLEAAKDLAGHRTFNATMIARWLELDVRVLREKYELSLERSANWGIERLAAPFLPLAVDLARAGVQRDRPKPLIWEAHKAGMTYLQIASLLDVHRQTVRRVVGKLNGETWAETH